jgi:hypothetical protein
LKAVWWWKIETGIVVQIVPNGPIQEQKVLIGTRTGCIVGGAAHIARKGCRGVHICDTRQESSQFNCVVSVDGQTLDEFLIYRGSYRCGAGIDGAAIRTNSHCVFNRPGLQYCIKAYARIRIYCDVLRGQPDKATVAEFSLEEKPTSIRAATNLMSSAVGTSAQTRLIKPSTA